MWSLIRVAVLGVGAIGAFVFITSFIVWLGLKMTLGIRLSADAETVGGDLSELGHAAGAVFVPEGKDKALA